MEEGITIFGLLFKWRKQCTQPTKEGQFSNSWNNFWVSCTNVLSPKGTQMQKSALTPTAVSTVIIDLNRWSPVLCIFFESFVHVGLSKSSLKIIVSLPGCSSAFVCWKRCQLCSASRHGGKASWRSLLTLALFKTPSERTFSCYTRPLACFEISFFFFSSVTRLHQCHFV